MNWVKLGGLGIVLFSTVLITVLAFLRRKSTLVFRDIPTFTYLRKAIGLAVEEGSHLHISLGRGGLATPQSAVELAGLEMLRDVNELTADSDQPPVATSGDGAVALLSQNALSIPGGGALSRGYDPTAARLTGLTPFSYAAGVLPVMQDENISANVLMGNLGVEAALLTDAAERSGTSILGGSDDLSAQAILYGNAQHPLIGEEVYAAGAYLKPRPFHTASLTVQDILRWLVVISILLGAVLKLAGVL